AQNTPNRYQCRLRHATLTIAFYRGENLPPLKLRFKHAAGVEVSAIFKTVMMLVTFPNANVCDRLNPPCPIRARQTYTYSYTTAIAESFPLDMSFVRSGCYSEQLVIIQRKSVNRH
ncbi:hypothetical protein X801_04552, partial [Opisthorchis viverrini]